MTNKELYSGLEDLASYFHGRDMELNAVFLDQVSRRLRNADILLAKLIFRKGEMFDLVEAWRNGRD